MSPTFRTARFAWALGSAALTFVFPTFVSTWRPYAPVDWQRKGWL